MAGMGLGESEKDERRDVVVPGTPKRGRMGLLEGGRDRGGPA